MMLTDTRWGRGNCVEENKIVVWGVVNFVEEEQAPIGGSAIFLIRAFLYFN